MPSSTISEDVAPTSPVATIQVPDVARAFQPRRDWIVHERKYALQAYASASKRAGGVLPENDQTKAWLDRIDGLLKLHEFDFEISPKMRDEAAIDTYLKFMFNDERFHFPQSIQDRARALYEEYEACNWTATGHDNDDDEDDDDDSVDMNNSSPTGLDGNNDPPDILAGNVTIRNAIVKLPPRNDPIWGLRGIMHGVAPKLGKIKTLVIDPRYLRDKRRANVFGHNSLEPGAWFPNQIVALFHGGHGARQGGVYGKRGVGTYSVVVSGSYKEVDRE